jgi:uncharacterized protein YjiS (DUF1127 family)
MLDRRSDPSRHHKDNGWLVTIMRKTLNRNAVPRGIARQFWTTAVVALLRRWPVAYRSWKTERAAIAQLHSMSDRELKDIGLRRSVITGAVIMRGDSAYCYDALDA